MQDETFIYRVFFGFVFFGVLGFLDYKRHSDNPTRLKEYLFLFSVTILCMAYVIAHDYATYSISREYFTIGKGIESAVTGFNFDIVKIALLAGWTPGLIIGASFLLANNPKKKRPQLNYRKLFRLLSIPLSVSIMFAVLLGISFYTYPNFFANLLHLNLSNLSITPQTFIAVWGIHIGSYLGGLIGLIAGIIKIKHLRNTLTYK